MSCSFTLRTSFPSEGGRGDWGSTSYRTTCRTAGSCEGKEWTLHEHVIDGKSHKYTAINLDNYPWQLCVWTSAAHLMVCMLCAHTHGVIVHNQWKTVTFYLKCAQINKQTIYTVVLATTKNRSHIHAQRRVGKAWEHMDEPNLTEIS